MKSHDPPFVDYYALFEIPENASPEEVKQAYRDLVKRYYPDLYSANPTWQRKADALMRLVNQAYAILSNPQRRQHYDHLLWAQRQTAFNLHQSDTLDQPDPYPSSPQSWPELIFDWFDRQRGAAQERPLISTFRKLWLLPLPFCLATSASSLFWNLGQMLNAPFLGGVTAILAYLLLLAAAFGRLLLPIRHRPLLTLTEKMLCLPVVAAILVLAGWLWITIMDQGGRGSNPWDLCWWCGVLGFTCAWMAYL
ncbi:MAG TPA: J domain-containing protein [Ktedonobacterales bacterium]|jgi:hypothetical protein